MELSLLEGKEQQRWWMSEAAAPAAQTGQQKSIPRNSASTLLRSANLSANAAGSVSYS